MQCGHIQSYELFLKTKSPLFVGSGKSYSKKEYMYDRHRNKISIIDSLKLFSLLNTEKRITAYENYMLKDLRMGLSQFLSENHITEKEMDALILYSVEVPAGIEYHTLKEINCFVRDEKNRPYIPGSSLKGALRTILLTKMIRDDQEKYKAYKENKIRYKDNDFEYMKNVEKQINRLNETLNHCMRGFSISDSCIIDSQYITAVGKDDLHLDGKVKTLPMLRECIKPQTTVKFLLAIDERGKDIAFIRKAIAEFGDYYSKFYEAKFKKPPQTQSESFKNCIVLGGGSGYFSKNLIYPLYGAAGIEYVKTMMKKKFRLHKHHLDTTISPHCLKYTTYNHRHYPFGVCEIEIK